MTLDEFKAHQAACDRRARIAFGIIMVLSVIILVTILSSCVSTGKPKPVKHTEAEYQALEKRVEQLSALPAKYDKTVAIYTFPQPTPVLPVSQSEWQKITGEIPVVGNLVGTTGSAVGNVMTSAATLAKSLPVIVPVSKSP